MLFRGVIDDDALVQQLLYGGVGMDPGAEDIDLDEVVACLLYTSDAADD